MPKNKGARGGVCGGVCGRPTLLPLGGAGKGGKNRRRGKNEGEEKRELEFREDGQREWLDVGVWEAARGVVTRPVTRPNAHVLRVSARRVREGASHAWWRSPGGTVL